MIRQLSPRRYVLLALVLSLAIAALFARALLTLRDEQWDHARQTNANLVHTIEQNISRTIDGYNQSLEGIVDGMKRPDIRALPRSTRRALLFDRSLRMAGMGSTLVLDEAGNIVLDSASEVPRKVNLADRDYFQVHRQGAIQGLFVGAPLHSRLANGALMLPLSRAYFHDDGSFAGVVVGSIRVQYFDELFASVNLGPASRANLWREDGMVLANVPSNDAAVGSFNMSYAQLRRAAASDHGTYTGIDLEDGIDRMHVFRRVRGYPLVVGMAQPVDTILAQWRRSAMVWGGFAALLVLASLGLAWLFVRELRRRQAIGGQLRQAEHDLSTILHNLPSMVAYWDKSLHNRYANQAYLSWSGLSAEQLRARRMDDVAGPRLFAQVEPYVKQALQGHRQVFERILRMPSGETRYGVVSYIPDLQDDTVQGFFVQIDDLTERKRMEDMLFEEKELVRLTLQAIGDAVICTDAEGHVTYLNPVAEVLTGWQAFDASGQHVNHLAPLQMPSGHPEDPSPVQRALVEGKPQLVQRGVVLRRRDGQEIEVEQSASPITDLEGRVTGAVMVLRDVTEAMALSRRMAHLAQYDALTDLPNRLLLQDRAQQAIARAKRNRHSVALIYIDLDGFKQVNDTLGHDAGDLLLKQVAKRFTGAVRQSDTVCRQGGDEFVVLLPALDHWEQACVVARKLIDSLTEPMDLPGERRRIGLSGGIALYPQDGKDFEALARAADAAMYAAKRAGRNRFYLSRGPDAPAEPVPSSDGEAEPAGPTPPEEH